MPENLPIETLNKHKDVDQGQIDKKLKDGRTGGLLSLKEVDAGGESWGLRAGKPAAQFG